MYRLCAEFILILVQKISYPPPVLPEPLAEEEFVNIFQKLTNKCAGLYCFCNSTPYNMYVKVDLKVDTPGLKVDIASNFADWEKRLYMSFFLRFE